MTTTAIEISRVREGFDDLPLPNYATDGAAGMDFRAALVNDITLLPGERSAVPTGIAIALPRGFECQVRPRSGLAFRHGIAIVNSPGTVDEDYRGEIVVLVVNLGDESFTIRRGERIAQGVVARYERVVWNEVATLEATERGTGGFGSTGVG